MKSAVCFSHQVADLVSAKDRRPELGLQAALNWNSEANDRKSNCEHASWKERSSIYTAVLPGYRERER